MRSAPAQWRGLISRLPTGGVRQNDVQVTCLIFLPDPQLCLQQFPAAFLHETTVIVFDQID